MVAGFSVASKFFRRKRITYSYGLFLQGYYEKDGKTMLGSGWLVPLVLEIERNTDGINIIGHKAPRNGELYGQDIKKMFPENICT